MTTIMEAAHELHGGDETPKPMDCPVCEADIDYFIRWGGGQPLSMLRCSECGDLLDAGVCANHGVLDREAARGQWRGHDGTR